MHVKEQKHWSLHPFWRVAIVFGAAIVLWLMVQNTVSAIFGGEYSRTTHVIRAFLIFSLAVPMVVAARQFLDHKTSFNGLGRLKDVWRPFAVGVAAWLIPASLMLVTAVAAGWTDIVVSASIVAVLGNLASLIVLVFIFEAFPEELIFRGYIFRNLAAVKPLWFAVIGQAFLFMAWGALNGGEVTIGTILLFTVFGLVTGAMRAITGSIWVSIGYHVAFQAIAQLFGSVGGGDIAFSSEGISMLVIGAAPIGFAIPVLGWFYKKRPDWRARIPE